MPFHETEIHELVVGIWSTTLGLEAQPSDQTRLAGDDVWTSCVQIHGAWEGHVLLSCSDRMARLGAAVMFDVPADAASTEQLRDALGELSNIVAGNFKSLLPSACFLGLPSVAERAGDFPQLPDVRTLTEVGFRCQDDALLVTIGEASSSPATSPVGSIC